MTDGTEDQAVPITPAPVDIIGTLKKSFVRLNMPIFPIYTVFDGKCTCGDPKCESQGKHPCIRSWKDDRSTNTGKVQSWIETLGRCNWGGATGKISGVFAVDIDPRHGGTDSFNGLEKEHGKIPDTRIHQTGGGGVHIIFAIPRGMTIPNITDLLPGIDIKGEDGYIVLPPSRHISGGEYVILNDVPPTDPPGWLISLIKKKDGTSANVGGTKFQMPAEVKEKSRNDTLFRAARSLAMKGLSKDAALAALLQENSSRCVPPLQESEVKEIIESAYSGRYEVRGGQIRNSVDGIAEIAELVKLVIYKKDVSGKVKTDDNKNPIIDRITLDNQKMAVYLADRFHTLSTGGDVYVYKDGAYSRDGGELHQIITAVCAELGVQNQKNHITEVMSMLIGTNFYPDPPFNYELGKLPFRNGVVKINFETGEISGPVPHSPENKFTYLFPVDYNPDSPTQPVLDVLNQWVEPADGPLLIQAPAQGLIQSMIDKSFKRCYLLQGEKDSGKSTYLVELLPRLFGKSFGDNRGGAISGVSLQRITNGRFALADLENKILNIFDDLGEEELMGFGTFKQLTGGTYHQVERKHRDPVNARIFCVHIFSCNAPPAVPERAKYDIAFWGRWEFIKFPYTFTVDPLWIDKTFTDEFLSGFFNLVVQEMIRIYTARSLTTIHDEQEVMEKWYQTNDPLFQFIEENTTTDDVNGKPISKPFIYGKDELFEQYTKYCEENLIDPRKKITTIEKFSREIQKFGFISERRTILKDGKKDKKIRERMVVYTAYRLWLEGMAQVEPGKNKKNKIEGSPEA